MQQPQLCGDRDRERVHYEQRYLGGDAVTSILIRRMCEMRALGNCFRVVEMRIDWRLSDCVYVSFVFERKQNSNVYA